MSDVDRRVRVIDMMVSMHSRLAQVYRRRGLLVDVGILIGSAVVVAGVFAEGAILSQLGLEPGATNITVRVLSLTVFILSIVSLRVDWSGRSREHEDARRKLARLKHAWRKAKRGDLDSDDIANLRERTDYVMSTITEIPDSSFNRLKAYHRRKVRVSRMLDDHPTVPLPVLRVVSVLVDIRRITRNE